MLFVVNVEEYNKEKVGLAQLSMKQVFVDDVVVIDEVVKEDVLYMKVDVEGFELSVFVFVQNLIKDYIVCYIFFEMIYYLYKWIDVDYLMILEFFDGYGYCLYYIEVNYLIKNFQQMFLRGGFCLKVWFDKFKVICDIYVMYFC